MRHDVMGIGGLAHLKGETGPQLRSSLDDALIPAGLVTGSVA